MRFTYNIIVGLLIIYICIKLSFNRIQHILLPNQQLLLILFYRNHYPFFQSNDDRWKNSIRHNLSINPYFMKGEKARNGSGHLWMINEEGRGLKLPYVNAQYMTDLILLYSYSVL